MAFLKKYLGLIFVILFALIIISRIFHSGFFSVHDDTQPTRIYEMSKSLKDGLFPVRWVDDLGFGYGYPIFNYYAPFPYYFGSIFNLIGFDAITSAKIMFSFAVLLAGIGMYLFTLSFLGNLSALSSSIVYMLFPYLAVNIFIRGAVGEYFAYSILPYIFWGFFNIYYKKPKIFSWQIILTALATALLIISHNLSAFMLTVLLIPFLLTPIFLSKNKTQIMLKFFAVITLAFLLSSFYTLPAIFEMNFSDVNSQLAGNFSYTNHFVCPIQWWDSPWGFAGSTEGCLDGISFRLGKSNIIFAIFSIFFGFYLIFFKRKSEYALLFSYSLFMLSFSLFMMTEYSVFIWQSIPKIDFLQFPWRFLNYSGFSISLLIGFLIYFTSIKYKKFTYLMLTLIISSTLIFNLKLFSPQNYLTINDEFYTLEKNIKYNISSITSEYMPSGFRKPQNEDEIPATILQIKKGSGKVKIIQNKTGYILSEIKMNTTGTIHINKAYFPAWSLIIDSKQASLKKVSDGMEFVLPSGNHKVILQFIQTPIENFANILTFTGVIMVIIGIIRSKYKYVKKTS